MRVIQSRKLLDKWRLAPELIAVRLELPNCWINMNAAQSALAF